MKNIVRLLIAAFLVIPVISMTGCACADNDKMHREHGGKHHHHHSNHHHHN